MRVAIIRHGKAERHSESGLDADRELTGRGTRQAEWLAQHLSDRESPPTLLLVSPIVRAQQTAGPIATALGLTARTEPRLTTDVGPSDVLEAIAEHEMAESLALVGHNPHFEQTISLLAVGHRHGVRLRTGEAAILDLEDPREAIGRATLVDMVRLDD